MRPHPDEIRKYYDTNIQDKLRDYVEGNDRIECAWRTVVEWAPTGPRRILEVGCGVGHVTARMRQRWPKAEIVAVDISGESIRLARLLFSRRGMTFLEGTLAEVRIEGTFDLIVLMDVYEHVAAEERQRFHVSLERRIGPECRVIITCPTPRVLAWSRAIHPEAVQPIDEDVDLGALQCLAADLRSRVVHYREVDVWHVGDYFHAVLERQRAFGEEVTRKPAAQSLWRAVSRLMQRLECSRRRARVARALREPRIAPGAE